MSEMCSYCQQSFGSASDLVVHVKSRHRHEDPASTIETNPEAHTPGYVCTLCGRRYPTPEALAAHDRRPHPRPRSTTWRAPVAP